MADILLHGWDSVNATWRKFAVNADGKVIIDPTAIFENPPIEDETKKAPSSEWAFDHKENASVHHAKYTDAEAVAAPGNRVLVITTGNYTNLNVTDYSLIICDTRGGAIGLYGMYYGSDYKYIRIIKPYTTSYVKIYHASGSVALGRQIWGAGGATEYISTSRTGSALFVYYGSYWFLESLLFQSTEDFIEGTPIASHTRDAISSSWAYYHVVDVDAHHAKYTDAEAQEACNLDGTMYWTCDGAHFDTLSPDVDDITKTTTSRLRANVDGITLIAHVSLPHGATVTGCKVYGNVAASDETWILRKITLTTTAGSSMATAAINTEDTTIGSAIINNELYAYTLYTTSIDINDEIWGARITYTL